MTIYRRGDRMKRNIFPFWIIVIVLVFSSITAYAYSTIEIFYWYSNGSNIGHWTSTPTISNKKLNSNTSFYFSEGYTTARTQWSSAGISTTNVGTGTSGNIKCYGGTAAQLVAELGKPASDFDGVYGITYYSSSLQYYLDYYGTTKYLRTISSAKVCILDKGRNLPQTKKTFMHEVGHALGWFGHSVDSEDVMYGSGSSVDALTNHDKLHLLQVY